MIVESKYNKTEHANCAAATIGRRVVPSILYTNAARTSKLATDVAVVNMLKKVTTQKEF